MAIRDIFVPLAPGVCFDPQFDAAARLARSLDAHVNVVFTREAMMTAASVPEMLVAAGVVVEAIEHETELAETSAITSFEQWRIANDLTGADENGSRTVAIWHERIGTLANTIAEIGRVSDLVIIGRSYPDDAVTGEMFRAAISSTGCPTMIVPDRLADDLLAHVLIAWNGSIEAAHAVAGAMPMLEAAKRVSIFAVPENSKTLYHHLGLIEHLEHHGVHAEWVEPSSWSSDVGLQLAQTASHVKASMIVMGAYTHHRVTQVFLGGVTQHMLKHAEIPVMMMH
jgi:nucleotide-binding universal stress UspA family protein